MSFNCFLFADKSIHNFFINGIKYELVQQILPIIMSIIITHIIDILLCYLSMTDRYIYEIKDLPKFESVGHKIFLILRRMRIWLIVFFISVFFISIFYWYLISSFCAVYKNSQIIYIINCVISLVIFWIDPFIVYFILTLLRIIAIKKNKNKKFKCLYKLSRLFPIF